jgi:hypothetical protein
MKAALYEVKGLDGVGAVVEGADACARDVRPKLECLGPTP